MKTVILFFSLVSSIAFAKERTVTVSGDCLRNLTPDRGTLTLVSEVNDLNPGTATQKVMDHYTKIRDRVKKLNLKNLELETSEFTVNEEFDWNGNVRKSRGYKARMGLRVVTSETSRLGELAALASELKVQDISGLQTFVSRETLKAEHENCLEEALKNAKSKAEKLAKSGGARLGGVLEIQEELMTGDSPRPRPLMMAKNAGMAMEASSSSREFEAGTSKVSVSVQASFELQ
jgi:hypothetical protein